MGGKSKSATQTTNSKTNYNNTTTNNPWGPASPALSQMITAALGAYGSTPKTGFGGQLFARPNESQLTAQQLALGAADRSQIGVNDIRQLGLDTIAGKYMDPASNPFIRGAVDAAINPLRDQFNANVLSIGDAAQMAGAYGGSRQGVVEGTALSKFNRDAMDVSSGIYYDNYSRERQNQLVAPALLQQAINQDLVQSQLYDKVGQQTQEWDQAVLNEALQKYNMSLEAPWAGLDKLATILGTVSPYGTSTSTGSQTTNSTTTGTPAQGSKAGGLFSGALGGASAGSAFGPWGAGIGAVIGGLGGLFG